jgi:P27 family predicted phage terminase small subunit
MKGRKPKPTVLKRLHGTQKCRLNPLEPNPVGDIGPAPDWLDDISKVYWCEVTGTMGRAWTAADRGPLEVLCKSYSRWRQMETELETKGLTYYPNGVREIVIGGATKLVGEARKRPQVAIVNMYYAQYCRLCAEFGITPSARTRIISGGGSDDDILDEL